MSGGLSILRSRVNGSLLNQFSGRNVSIMGKVLKTFPTGKAFDIQTGDRQVVTVLLNEPLSEPLSGLVEIHGISQGRGQVQCEYFISFPNEIAETYNAEMDNEAVALMHAIENPWRPLFMILYGNHGNNLRLTKVMQWRFRGEPDGAVVYTTLRRFLAMGMLAQCQSVRLQT